MAEQLIIGNPPIAVTVRRSARARRFSLRISNADGAVSLTMPKRAPMDQAVAFAQTQESWLRRHLGARPDVIVPAFGGQVMFDGAQVTIAPGPGRRVVLDGQILQVPGSATGVPGRVRGFLQAAARDRLSAASDRYAAALGQAYAGLSLRDTRSRWGSCTSERRLMYSWRLVMAPPAVQDYVAAHEVCHLQEMNHSPAFWSLVARICPDFEAPRAWLRDNGPLLHRYRF